MCVQNIILTVKTCIKPYPHLFNLVFTVLALALWTYFLLPFPSIWCNHKRVCHSIPLIILLQEDFHVYYSVHSDPEFQCLVSVQDMVKVSFHFVRGKSPKNFASTLVNFMGKVSSHFSHFKQFSLTCRWDTFWCLSYPYFVSILNSMHELTAHDDCYCFTEGHYVFKLAYHSFKYWGFFYFFIF